MDLLKTCDENELYIIGRRRYYHSCPELSGKEEHTRLAIKYDLLALGITDLQEMQDCYGLTAVVHGKHPGPRLGIRADIDGLPIVEETGLPFASANGAMHACGHDNHIAMALGAARILQEYRDELHGDVKFIFQPSEENASGAGWMVREHATDDIDALYGTHIWGQLEAGKFDVTPGNRMSAADLFSIDVYGKSAHGGTPHLGCDAIAAAVAIYTNLQQIVSRMNDPLNPMVIAIGEFVGGPRFNVLCDHVHMVGTTRYFSNALDIEATMRRVIEDTAAAMGARAELNYIYKSPAVINSDERLNRIAENAVKKLYGTQAIGCQEASMGGEDFPILATRGVPYFFSFLGSKDADHPYINHHQKYTVDESVLKRGTALAVQFALDYLG